VATARGFPFNVARRLWRLCEISRAETVIGSPRRKEEKMIRLAALVSLLFCLTACSADLSAQNERCKREAPANATERWGYYPGYGCGVIPRQVSGPFG